MAALNTAAEDKEKGDEKTEKKTREEKAKTTKDSVMKGKRSAVAAEKNIPPRAMVVSATAVKPLRWSANGELAAPYYALASQRHKIRIPQGPGSRN